MFIVVVISNLIVDIGEEEKTYLTKPIRFFSGAILVSVIGGYGMNWINNYSKRKQSNKEDD